jgi:hypothetical protein
VAVVEATFAKGHAVVDGGAGVEIPLEGAQLLLGGAGQTPASLFESNFSLEDAEVFLDPGRYILLLGSGSPGRYYLLDGRYGAFAFADVEGNSLSRMCTTYIADGKAHAPTRSSVTVSRKSLLTLAEEAAKTMPAPTDIQPAPTP